MVHRHILKLNVRYAGEILCGRKRFEVRNNDRSFQRGDEIQFKLVDDDGNNIEDGPCSPLAQAVFRITFVVTGYGLKEGYCAFGFEDIEEK